MPYLSIKAVGEEIHSGIITPTELVAEALERIDALDDDLKAYVTVMRDQAYEDAERLERELRTGLYRSPLHGIPIGVKDIIAVKGVRTTAGSKVLADYVSQEDAMVVEQLRKKGAIVIGKTNTHEFAYGTYTPPTRNPWDHERIPGGSSGGSAVAVASPASSRPTGVSVVMALFLLAGRSIMLGHWHAARRIAPSSSMLLPAMTRAIPTVSPALPVALQRP